MNSVSWVFINCINISPCRYDNSFNLWVKEDDVVKNESDDSEGDDENAEKDGRKKKG